MEEGHITVPRTARYHWTGDPSTAREAWFVLHGYGQLARYFLNNFEGLQRERLIVAPEALGRFYTDGSFGRVGASWMTREDRENEIADQVTYLDRLHDHTLERAGTVRTVHVLGFSQGVATASRWADRSAHRFDQLVFWGGSMPPELQADRLQQRWHGMRIDLVHGEQDEVVGAEVLERNEGLLRGAQLAFESRRFPGGHELDPLVLERVMTG